tara:strand:+ start:855 stop:1958 length:1104 start_codon:yes stop_codon:yes gene_type:complete
LIRLSTKINALKNILATIIFLLFLSSCEDKEVASADTKNPLHEISLRNIIDSTLDVNLLKESLDELIELNYLRAVAISYNDQLIFDYFKIGNEEQRYPVYSVTKSVLSAAFGLAFDQNLIDSEDTTIDSFLNIFNYNDPEIKKTISVKHLLSMQSGIRDDTNYIRRAEPIKYILDQDLLYAPGKFWNYSFAGTHILSAVFEKITNKTPEVFVNEHLFEPLGIENYYWEVDANGLSNGGWGLHLTLHDMIKLGRLYSNDGKWESRQLISSSWVDRSTLKNQFFSSGSGSWAYLPNNESGYGYLWWINNINDSKVFSALGYGGQYIIIDKHKKLVIAIASKESSTNSYRKKISSIVFEDIISIFPQINE